MQAKQRNRRSYTTKHSQHMIDLAVDALQNKTMSSYDAEKIFGIPRRTLLDKLHNKHPKSPGCPTRLNDQEEANIIKVLLAAAEYGSPLTLLDLRIVVHRYLEGNGRLSIFDNKLPGKKWVYSFIKRHKSKLAYRVVQNIKRSRAEKTPDEMKEYFRNLQLSLEGVPSDNILNYDETNLTDPNKKVRNKKLHVPPGKSVCTSDFENLNILPKKVGTDKRQRKKNSNTMQLNPDLLLQPHLLLINPDSLKTLCLRSINNHLVQSEQYKYSGEQTSQVPDVHNLCDISKNYNTNMRFINEIPKCLQTNKPRIIITSDVTIKPGEFTKQQESKQGNINIKQTKSKITRSALHMKLIPARKEALNKRREVLEDITEEIKGLEVICNNVSKKPTEENRQRRLIKKESNKAKKKTQKCKSMKQNKKYNSSESSFTSDTEISIADTEDSEYETMDDFITSQQEEENIEPSIPYGISDIKYLTEDDKMLETDSWILAKFTTKKSMKHFVGKVISIKDNIPEVKFVRKKKESKFDRGLVFSYPRVDDICTMQHLDDVIMKLPDPNISRRGEIIFNIDLSNYNVQ